MIAKEIKLPLKMKAVLTEGIGGYDKLKYTEVETPKISKNEVLLKVLAAGINNTDINTRIGWYSSKINADTDALSKSKFQNSNQKSGLGWNGTTNFPLIQGTDCCGEVVSVGSDAVKNLIGKRVLVRPCMKLRGLGSAERVWMASDFDGAFSEYVKVPFKEVFPVNSNWTDAELASIPCAYGTAENMLFQSKCGGKTKILITGASGGVGSAALQLAKRRGANVSILTSSKKKNFFKEFDISYIAVGAEELISSFGERSFDIVLDPVGGQIFPSLIKLLKKGGTYISSGAIAGPIVNLDLRDLYLKDLKVLGATAWSDNIFPNLIGYIEKDEIKPIVAETFPLKDIVEAQKKFLKKRHLGKFILVP